MGSEPERKPTRKDIALSDYGARAAIALNSLVPSEKLAARAFNCSVRMAQYLRAGQYWTTDRLSQASRVLGAEFDRLLAAPDTATIHRRIREIEGEIADLRRRLEGGDNA